MNMFPMLMIVNSVLLYQLYYITLDSRLETTLNEVPTRLKIEKHRFTVQQLQHVWGNIIVNILF